MQEEWTVQHVTQLLNEMRGGALMLRFNSVISACQKGRQWQHMAQLLNEMQECSNVQPQLSHLSMQE
eukprot:6319912-Karenia_brevis.AAC.1